MAGYRKLGRTSSQRKALIRIQVTACLLYTSIRKGREAATKNLVEIPMDENNSVPHDFIGKFGSATVLLKKAPEGTGIIAGGPARNVLELAGIKNIRTKSLGSNNKTNVVLALSLIHI